MADKELTLLERIEKAIGSMTPSTVTGVERIASKPAPEISASMRASLESARKAQEGTLKAQEGTRKAQAGTVADYNRKNNNTEPIYRESAGNQRSSVGRQMTAADATPAETAPRMPSSKPTQLDLSTPAAQAEFNRFVRAAPPAETAPRMPESTVAPAPAPAPAPAAPTERDINAFFETATGTPFDPKSRVDIARRAELEDFLKSKPELVGKSNVQASLQWYRQMANAKRK